MYFTINKKISQIAPKKIWQNNILKTQLKTSLQIEKTNHWKIIRENCRNMVCRNIPMIISNLNFLWRTHRPSELLWFYIWELTKLYFKAGQIEEFQFLFCLCSGQGCSRHNTSFNIISHILPHKNEKVKSTTTSVQGIVTKWDSSNSSGWTDGKAKYSEIKKSI